MADIDNAKDQKEHASYFASGPDEEEPPETRYDPVEIDLSQPEPKKDANGQPVAPQLDGASEQLRAQLNQARQQIEMANRVAMEQAQRAQQAEQRAIGSTAGMIDQALAAAEQHAVNVKARFQAALDAADHATAAQAQEEMTDARHNLLRLQEQKAYVEAEVRRPPQAVPPQQQPQPQPARSQETIIRDLANTGYPRSADWLRNHPEWMGRQEYLDRVAKTHNYLVETRGMVPETDEYFAALEQELGVGQRRSSAPDYSDNAVRRRAAAPTSNAAPSLRTGQVPRAGNIRLTPAQQEIAELSGMSNREYAEEFEAARQGGKLLGYR